MAKLILTVAEKREAKGLIAKIERAQNALLKNGGRVSLFYLRPPSSKRVETKIIKHFSESLKMRFTSGGIHFRDIRVLANIR